MTFVPNESFPALWFHSVPLRGVNNLKSPRQEAFAYFVLCPPLLSVTGKDFPAPGRMALLVDVRLAGPACWSGYNILVFLLLSYSSCSPRLKSPIQLLPSSVLIPPPSISRAPVELYEFPAGRLIVVGLYHLDSRVPTLQPSPYAFPVISRA